jgi:hypothetical protein
VGGAGERVQDVAGALALRIDDVEGLAVEPVLVSDVVDRRGDPVDRDHVRPAPLDRDQREPLGQRVPQLLDGLEEVVRAVDLVHLARLGIADHDRRAVHAPRHGEAFAHELLGLELRAVVRMLERLPLVEHVLVESALVQTRDGDRGDVVEAPGLDRVREVDRVLCAADVEHGVARLVRGHVVDRGEVEEVVDLRKARRVDAQPAL